MTLAPELEHALREARALTKAHGSSYYLSTLLFPPQTRDAVFALYGLLRKADNIVDTVAEGEAVLVAERLDAFEKTWWEAYEKGYSEDSILYAAAWVFRTYDIPFSYSEDFFKSMRTDTTTYRYATYADLEKYMYGSAAVVGFMLTKIIGAKDENAHAPARDLAYAMQLTNFLRDIREDYIERKRIYLPQDELDQFGVTEQMIADGIVTPEFTAMMIFQVARARKLYAEADAGIPFLSRSGRKPVRLARVLYAKILDRIEDADYDVFSQRRYTTSMQKVRYALPVLMTP